MKEDDLYIQLFKECDVEEWDRFVDECDEAWFWHNSLFLNSWPYGENISFCIRNNNEIVLLQVLFFQGHIKKKGLHFNRWHHIPYLSTKVSNNNLFHSVGGIARKKGLSLKQERRLQSFYIDMMRQLIVQYQIRNFDYSIQATCSRLYWPDCCPLVNPLIFFGYKNTISQAYVIDLSQSEEDIFRGYVQTTRNLINRTQKDTGIVIVEAKATQEDLDKYYELHVETYKRTGVTPHPKEYFEKIFFGILPLKKCHILFLYKNDKLIVAHNTLIYKDVAMYWTGCSVTDKGDGETRLLMHNQIIWAKKNGCKFFEVGECFPNVFEGKLKGLNDFKKSFGGFIHPIFSGSFLI